MHYRITSRFIRHCGRLLLGLLVFGFLVSTSQAADLRIAAASDLRFVLPELLELYGEQAPEDQVQVVYGSSGRLASQIQNGAPFDFFLAADTRYPQALVDAEQALGPITPYAYGQLALWHRGSEPPTLVALQAASGRVAIANPRHAPYGERAHAWLAEQGLLTNIQDRLVFAESVAQSAHYVRSGSAEFGIIALSLALSEPLQAQGNFLPLPIVGEPMVQGMVVTQSGQNNPAAVAFKAFMNSPPAQKVLSASGFSVPEGDF